MKQLDEVSDLDPEWDEGPFVDTVLSKLYSTAWKNWIFPDAIKEPGLIAAPADQECALKIEDQVMGEA